MLVVEVAVPALRRDSVGVRRLRHRVPQVDVLELRPEAEVRVRDVEHAVRRAGREPGVVEPERRRRSCGGARRTPSRRARAAPRGRRPAPASVSATKPRRLLLDRAATPRARERARRTGRRSSRRRRARSTMRCCDVVELGRRAGEVAAARAVREDAVVQRVRRAHSALLERRRDVVDPRGEACLRPVHGRAVRYPTCRACPREPPSAFVLYRDSRAPARGAARAAPETRRATACTGSTSSRAAASTSRHDLEPALRAGCSARARRSALLDRACASAAATRATSRACSRRSARLNRCRRRLLDRRHGRDPARAPRARSDA